MAARAYALLRLIRIYFCFARMSWRRLVVFPLDFLIGVLAVAILEGLGLATIFFVIRELPSVRGWTFWEVVFVYGFFAMAKAVWHVFMVNCLDLSGYVRSGRLDRFLTRPLDPLFQIYADGWDEDGWGELHVGGTLLGLSVPRIGLTIVRLPLVAVYVLAGTAVYASIILLASSLSFWTIENEAVMALVGQLGRLGQYPLPIYGRAMQWLLSTVVPFGFVGFWPATAFLAERATLLSHAFLAVVPL